MPQTPLPDGWIETLPAKSCQENINPHSLRAYRFTAHQYDKKKAQKNRMGVPGSPVFSYTTSVSFSWAGSIIEAVLGSRAFWFQFLLLVFCFAVAPYYPKYMVHDQIARPELFIIWKMCVVFVLTFFLSQSYDRWKTRLDIVVKVNGNVTT